MTKKPIKKGNKKGRDKKGRFVKGEYKGGPGRTQGLRDWITDFNNAVKIVAKETNKEESDVRTDLLIRGIGEARKGNFNFWQEIVKRNYGEIKKELDVNLTTRVKTLKKIDENLRKAIGK